MALAVTWGNAVCSNANVIIQMVCDGPLHEWFGQSHNHLDDFGKSP